MSAEQYSTDFQIGGTTFTLSLASPEEAPLPALLVPFLAWLRERGLLEPLEAAAEEMLSRHMRTRLHSPFDKLMTDVIAMAAATTTNFEVSTLLRPCLPLAEAAGQPAGFADHSGMSRFHVCFGDGAGETFRLTGQQALASHSLLREGNGGMVVDLDGTGFLTITEGSRRGYFGPRAQGKTGLQWHLATASPLGVFPTVRERLVAFLDPGNIPTKCRFYDLFWEVLDVLDQMGLVEKLDEDGRPITRRPLLWRFDGGITCGEFMEFLIELNQHAISRGHDGRTAPKMIREIGHLNWHWVSPNQEAAEGGQRLVRNCRYPLRVILLRNHQPKGDLKHSHLLTTLRINAVPLAEAVALAPDRPEASDPPPIEADDPGRRVFAAAALEAGTDSYNGRQTIEAAIKEEKRVLHRDHQRTHSFVANEALAQLGLHVANLLTWFKQDLFGDTPLQELGLGRFVHQALLLPAKLRKCGPESSDGVTGPEDRAKAHFELRLILPSLVAVRMIRSLMDRRLSVTRAPPAYVGWGDSGL